MKSHFNDRAERDVIGCLLLENSMSSRVSDLPSEVFYSSKNKIVFETVMDLIAEGGEVDTTTVIDVLENEKNLNETHFELQEYLFNVIELVPSAWNIKGYAKMVEKNYIKRRETELFTQGIRDIQDGQNPGDVANRTRKKLEEIENQATGKTFQNISETGEIVFKQFEAIVQGIPPVPGLKTGWIDLDKLFNGLKPGNLTIIAGRPSMGKTTFSLNLIHNLACPCGYFSLEMTREEIFVNLGAIESKTDLRKILNGETPLTQGDESKIIKGIGKIMAMNFFICDTPAIPAGKMLAEAREMVSKGAKIIFVDHLGLVKSGEKTVSRYQEVSAISRAMKTMAKTLNVPVVVLCQLNRELRNNADKIPQLYHLRDSGSIEEDADSVILLHRPDYYSEQDRPGECDVILAKQRNGPTGKIVLRFLPGYFRFENMAGSGWG